MPKHEVPMSGKTWIGTVKLDDSTGLQMIQVALPVLDGVKPIGCSPLPYRQGKKPRSYICFHEKLVRACQDAGIEHVCQHIASATAIGHGSMSLEPPSAFSSGRCVTGTSRAR